MTFPAKMNTGCGKIELFNENSRDGIALNTEMSNGENTMKKHMASKWKQYMGDDDDGNA
jgi:hypothetical protein